MKIIRTGRISDEFAKSLKEAGFWNPFSKGFLSTTTPKTKNDPVQTAPATQQAPAKTQQPQGLTQEEWQQVNQLEEQKKQIDQLGGREAYQVIEYLHQTRQPIPTEGSEFSSGKSDAERALQTMKPNYNPPERYNRADVRWEGDYYGGELTEKKGAVEGYAAGYWSVIRQKLNELYNNPLMEKARAEMEQRKRDDAAYEERMRQKESESAIDRY